MNNQYVMKSRVALPAAGLLLCLAVAVPVSASEQAEPTHIRVVADGNFPPFLFQDADGRPQGYEADMWRRFEKRTGIHVELLPSAWRDAQHMMATGQADVIDLIMRTPERRQDYDFAGAVSDLDINIYLARDIQGIRDASALRGFPLGVESGSRCMLLLKKRGFTNLKTYPSYKKLIQAAVEQDLRGFCVNQYSAAYFLHRYSAQDQFHEAFTLATTRIYRAVRREDKALLQVVRQGMAAIPEAERQRLHDRWLKQPIELSAYMHVLVYAVAAIALILALLGLWVWLLRRRVAVRTRQLSSELTVRRQAQRRSRLGEQRLLLALESSKSEAWDWAVETGKIEYVMRPSAAEPSGHRVEYISFGQWQTSLHPDDSRETTARMAQFLEGGSERFDLEYRSRSDRDSYRWIHVCGIAVEHDKAGQPTRVVGVHTDITQRKVAEHDAEFLAVHDVLTSLPNIGLTRDRFDQAAALADGYHGQLAVVFVDVDHFKNVNDSLGHAQGDELIIAMAQRLRDWIRPGDTAGRQGGDEFVVVLSQIRGPEHVEQLMSDLLGRLGKPYWLAGSEIDISVSVGVALFPGDGRDFDTLRGRADMAMYQAKEAGRNIWRFYDRGMQAGQSDKLQIRNGLSRALSHNELVLHYQPQLSLADNRIIGVEALLRWQSPNQGLISPGRFMPVAEETGLIVPMGEWVLQEACRQSADWYRQGMIDLIMSVNLSVLQFSRGGLESVLQQALAAHDMAPRRLALEITESMLISDMDTVLSSVKRFKAMGISIALDDFGTGYASLSYLTRLDVDQLKIDRSFIMGLADNDNSKTIVRTIIQMAHSLGMKVIAEGVETREHMQWLAAAGCDQIQGYYLGRPMTADDFVQWLYAGPHGR